MLMKTHFFAFLFQSQRHPRKLWALFVMLLSGFALSSWTMSFRYEERFMMLQTALYHQGQVFHQEVGISATITHSLVDSTYAADVLKVDFSQLKSATINGKKGSYYTLRLDSLIFCGETYRNVAFLVLEGRSRFKGKLPDVVLGGNILRGRAWHVDLQRQTFTPCSPDAHYSKVRLKCTLGTGLENGFVYLKAKVAGQKIRLQFTLGLGNNILPHGEYALSSSPNTHLSGSFDRELTEATLPRYEHVTTRIGDFEFTADYELGYPSDARVGKLCVDALDGKSFVLNYKKKLIEVLE